MLGQRQQPLQNFVFFDGMETEAKVYALHPDGELGGNLLPNSAPMENGEVRAPVLPVVSGAEAIMLD